MTHGYRFSLCARLAPALGLAIALAVSSAGCTSRASGAPSATRPGTLRERIAA